MSSALCHPTCASAANSPAPAPRCRREKRREARAPTAWCGRWDTCPMPQNLLSEFTIVYVTRGDDKLAPPYVALTRDQAQAEREALAWARDAFGEGNYSVATGRFVGFMQGRSWGSLPHF